MKSSLSILCKFQLFSIVNRVHVLHYHLCCTKLDISSVKYLNHIIPTLDDGILLPSLIYVECFLCFQLMHDFPAFYVQT